ncbi:hypothetical protein [Niastella sp. OAS944]|uniref:hypothetical protein n=1 Tax=Niastella sp. OAS944 TaxID=2664089 RepID=UPI003484ECAC|nr:hypothetical protein [Chitinophagaceae bacterium OAS944]
MLHHIWETLFSSKEYAPWLIFGGLVIRFIVGGNRFARRGAGGLQHFSSYPVALFVRFFEFIASVAGLILIVKGGLQLIL